MQKTFFTAGPAALFPTFKDHMLAAMDLQIGSLSHRSQQFRDIYAETDRQLKTLLNVPADFGLFFTGTASEIWERIFLNLVASDSLHLVNGSFSKKFYEYGTDLGFKAEKLEKSAGQGFLASDLGSKSAELIALTQNETSTGVQLPVSEIDQIKINNPDSIVAVDMVSSAPQPDLDYTKVDTAFFSVQKAFGMPAGLGVWLASPACLDKANYLSSKRSIGAHHQLPVLWKNYLNFETPSTPNVLSIFILGKIAADLNSIGIEKVRAETSAKIQKLYQFFEANPNFSIGVENKAHRSDTVAVANCNGGSKDVIAKAKAQNLIIGSGYGPSKDSQIRVANFPATSMSDIDSLIECLSGI